MTLQKIIGLTFITLLFLSTQSCSDDIAVIDDRENSEITEAGAITPKKKYCKYNVTGKSSDPKINDADIVCMPCESTCINPTDSLSFKRKTVGSDGKDSIYVSGKFMGTRASKNCVTCRAKGSHISE